MILTFQSVYKVFRFFHMKFYFLVNLKTVRIFPDDCQFSEQLQNCPDSILTVPKLFRIFPDDFLFSSWSPIYYSFFGNVTRCKHALFRLGLRNGFARFVRKVFAHKKSPPGKFWVFVPLLYMKEDIVNHLPERKNWILWKWRHCATHPNPGLCSRVIERGFLLVSDAGSVLLSNVRSVRNKWERAP